MHLVSYLFFVFKEKEKSKNNRKKKRGQIVKQERYNRIPKRETKSESVQAQIPLLKTHS